MRLVFLNALPLNAIDFEAFTLYINRITFDDLRELLRKADEVVNFIRHPATLKIIQEKLGISLSPSSQLYKYRHGDLLVIVTLKKPVRGVEAMNITESDILLYLVRVDKEMSDEELSELIDSVFG